MRRFLLLLVFVFSLCLTSRVEARKLALLIGVDDYKNAPSLSCCVNDMFALKYSLMTIGFEEEDIQMLITGGDFSNYPTKKNIEQSIVKLFAKATSSDMVFIAFSGHGAQNGKKVYFCPYGADFSDLDGTCVSITSALNYISKCKAEHKWVIVDACRSISPTTIKSKRLQFIPLSPEGIALFQSCSKGEKSFDDRSDGNSYFVKSISAALSGEADSDHDGKLTLMEVCKWTALQTKTEVHKAERKSQRPFFSGSDSDFTLTENLNPDSNKSNPRIITVPDDYPTIEEAYEHVKDGGVISIKPGQYELSDALTVNRYVTFRGTSKRPNDVIIDSPSANAFKVTSCSPSFINLTVYSGSSFCASFSLTGGRPKLFQCIIQSRRGPGIFLYKEDSNPLVENCLIKDCDGPGVNSYDNARGTFNNCEFFGCAHACVSVRESANPTFNGCKIHDGQQNGVHVYESGRGIFNGCNIYRNSYSGIEIKTMGNPTVFGCLIHDGKQSGVRIHDGGSGTFNNTIILRNANRSWNIESDAGPVRGAGNKPPIGR